MPLLFPGDALELAGSNCIEPPQLPVRVIDLERASGCFDMMLPMADPCPECGAFNMLVGDWACWGMCPHCAEERGLLEF